MLPLRCFFVGLLIAWQSVASVQARQLPPGTYHEQGRIVAKADGQLAVFWGSYSYLFPKPLQSRLYAYVGDFSDIEYTRVADAPGQLSIVGSEIGDITKVDVKAVDPEHLPIVCRIKPTKSVYEFGEPVVVHVSVVNHTDEPQKLGLGTGGIISLCQDYERQLSLDWLEEYYSNDAP